MYRSCTVAAAVGIAHGSCSWGASAVVVGAAAGVALAVAHTEASAAFDGSAAAAGSESSSGIVDFPYMTLHFHSHTAGGAVAGDAVAGDTQPAAASAGGH